MFISFSSHLCILLFFYYQQRTEFKNKLGIGKAKYKYVTFNLNVNKQQLIYYI